MHMIGHKAIADDRGVPHLGVFLHQIEIHFSVLMNKEYVFAVVPSLDHMMR